MIALPDELIQQFRTVALERLDRVEAAWASILGSFDEHAALALHREIHTLKGESKMLGFTEVNLVCHKLEDLLEVARARGYAIGEDFDLTVNMAVRFMAMLVRKKVGVKLGGIDLPGFVRQIDTLLAESRPEPRSRITGQQLALRPIASTRVPLAVREQLAPVAAETFVEYTTSRGLRRDRMRASWHTLRDMIGVHRAMIGAAQLAKHESGAHALAKELGKDVTVAFDIATVEATAEMLAAVDVALLHLLRNALDHGLESATERIGAGKQPAGTVRVASREVDGLLVLTVDDDGRGVMLDAVRERAIELGLITPNEIDVTARWVDLVCHPGFTTRKQANDVSGRGVGLAAARTSIVELGGQLTATTRAGAGTSWRVELPLPRIVLDAHVLRVPGLPVAVAVDADWRIVPHGDGPVIDLAHRLGLVDTPATGGLACYLVRSGRAIGIAIDRPPARSIVRRIIATQPSPVEVVHCDGLEALLVHPDRLALTPTRASRATLQPS